MVNTEIDMKFELNDYKQELSDEEILADIKETAERLNKIFQFPFIKNMGNILRQQFKITLGHGGTLCDWLG